MCTNILWCHVLTWEQITHLPFLTYSFFLPHQTPALLLKQLIIPESQVSNVPLRMHFWRLWNLKFPLKIPSFPGRKTVAGFCRPRWIKMSCVALGSIFDVYGEKRMSFTRFCPLISTVITVSFSSRRGWPHGHSGGPAWLHCFGSSPTDQMCCHRASQCVQ